VGSKNLWFHPPLRGIWVPSGEEMFWLRRLNCPIRDDVVRLACGGPTGRMELWVVDESV
jgi:hypothetical protein